MNNGIHGKMKAVRCKNESPTRLPTHTKKKEQNKNDTEMWEKYDRNTTIVTVAT